MVLQERTYCDYNAFGYDPLGSDYRHCRTAINSLPYNVSFVSMKSTDALGGSLAETLLFLDLLVLVPMDNSKP